LADDDEDDDDEQDGGQQQALLLAARLPQGGQAAGTSPGFPSPEEETWAPFDPDNEDEEDEVPPSSRISDIEVVRAANDSLLSEDQTRRSSSILDNKDLPGSAAGAEGNQQPAQEEYEDDFNVPFADDSEDEQGPSGGAAAAAAAPALDDSMLQLSNEGGSATNNRSNLSGLDESPASKRSRDQAQESATKNRKRRKRRKVVIDNDKTELSNDHIRDMLRDTSDIVRRMVHPSSAWDEETVAYFSPNNQQGDMAGPPILTQPFLADEADQGGAYLHPRIRKLWQDNYWKALGQPCPFQKRTPQQDEDGDSVEQVRRDRGGDEETEEQSDIEVPMPGADDDDVAKRDENEDQDFDMPLMDEEDEEEPADAPALDFDDEEEDVARAAARDDDELDLGLVNDMTVDDEDDEDRQALGDVASSATKWHKHTVRVFQHLKKCMRDPNQEPENDEQEALPSQVEFHQITKNVSSRRNAASVFFEMLQLKTWDFIEVDQSDAYGDITISPGVRFSEAPPN